MEDHFSHTKSIENIPKNIENCFYAGNLLSTQGKVLTIKLFSSDVGSRFHDPLTFVVNFELVNWDME